MKIYCLGSLLQKTQNLLILRCRFSVDGIIKTVAPRVVQRTRRCIRFRSSALLGTFWDIPIPVTFQQSFGINHAVRKLDNRAVVLEIQRVKEYPLLTSLLAEIWKGVAKINNRRCIAKPTSRFRKSLIALVARLLCLLFCLISCTLRFRR